MVSPPLAHDCSHPFGEEFIQHQSVLSLNKPNPRHKKDVPKPNTIVIICIIGSARFPILVSLIPYFTRRRKSILIEIATNNHSEKKEKHTLSIQYTSIVRLYINIYTHQQIINTLTVTQHKVVYRTSNISLNEELITNQQKKRYNMSNIPQFTHQKRHINICKLNSQPGHYKSVHSPTVHKHPHYPQV